MKRLSILLGVMALTMLPASSAFADTLFDFSFSGLLFSGSGTFTASSSGSGQYLIDGITGSVSSYGGTSDIQALLAPGSYPTGTGPFGITETPNDNELFFPSSGYFDTAGVSFVLKNGVDVNLNSYASYIENAVAGPSNTTEFASFTVTDQGPAPSPTPEPGSLLLLGTGVLGVAGAMRRKIGAAAAAIL